MHGGPRREDDIEPAPAGDGERRRRRPLLLGQLDEGAEAVAVLGGDADEVEQAVAGVRVGARGRWGPISRMFMTSTPRSSPERSRPSRESPQRWGLGLPDRGDEEVLAVAVLLLAGRVGRVGGGAEEHLGEDATAERLDEG